MGSLLAFLTLLVIGFVFGKINEMNHFRRLDRDEQTYAHIDVYNIKRPTEPLAEDGVLVSGNVVIAVDYFKVIVAGLKMLIGGQLGTYQSLMTRARREAVLRLKREASDLGADAVYNIRIEYSTVGANPRGVGGVELFAYGTAVKRP